MPAPAPAPSSPAGFSAPLAQGGDPAIAPLTYQVYSAEGAPGGRSSPSLGAFAEGSAASPRSRPGMSLGARVCLVLLGVCVVVGTASLIVIGTADEPQATSPSATLPSAAPPSATPPSAASPSAPEPPPVVAVAPAPSPSPEPPPVAAAPAKSPKKARVRSAAPALRGVAVPPNPFGGSGATPAAKKK